MQSARSIQAAAVSWRLGLQAEVVEASKKALQACIVDTAAFGEMVMKQLIHSHPSPSQNGSGNSRCVTVLTALHAHVLASWTTLTFSPDAGQAIVRKFIRSLGAISCLLSRVAIIHVKNQPILHTVDPAAALPAWLDSI